MKKALLLLVFTITTFSYSQVVDYVKKTDFKQVETNRWRITDKSINLNNGNNVMSNAFLTIGIPTEIYLNTDVDKLNSMIADVNEKAKGLVKNKYTYESKIVKISFLAESQQWYITIEYAAQNDYGSTKDGVINAYYDDKFNLIKINAF
ncbi:hypothetical protein [Flavobacterium sp. 1355]|uniref:hypothetical protein n=1 Tax=Flavobacterium sp. 1355 TaxID=2806571 RepID=UPI001AE7D911|nr:hypothetical protein [Flavobacterium sp. 1355]MBP1222602.1 hypothetical protein [Flavobacterium sp. 1355]